MLLFSLSFSKQEVCSVRTVKTVVTQRASDEYC